MAEFGLTALIHNPHSHIVDSARLAAAQRVVRYIYERTQNVLSERGARRLELFRGIQTVQYVTGGIQSWTSNLAVAIQFDGYDVIREEIPAERILAFDGGPCWDSRSFLRESEYIVLAAVHS